MVETISHDKISKIIKQNTDSVDVKNQLEDSVSRWIDCRVPGAGPIQKEDIDAVIEKLNKETKNCVEAKFMIDREPDAPFEVLLSFGVYHNQAEGDE